MTIANLLAVRGTFVTIHIESDSTPCPCRTHEGFRDPVFHKLHPSIPECNDAGFLFESSDTVVKAIMLPASSGLRSGPDYLTQMFGDIQTDDYVGILPIMGIDFSSWSRAGENYILHSALGIRFTVVGHNLIPDPNNTSLMHHWELALRKLSSQNPNAVTVF